MMNDVRHLLPVFCVWLLAGPVQAQTLDTVTAQGRPLAQDFPRSSLIIDTSGFACEHFDIFVASERAAQSRGLMFVREMPDEAGMLFIYAERANDLDVDEKHADSPGHGIHGPLRYRYAHRQANHPRFARHDQFPAACAGRAGNQRRSGRTTGYPTRRPGPAPDFRIPLATDVSAAPGREYAAAIARDCNAADSSPLHVDDPTSGLSAEARQARRRGADQVLLSLLSIKPMVSSRRMPDQVSDDDSGEPGFREIAICPPWHSARMPEGGFVVQSPERCCW